ncbi:sulfite exporter TauE/SafE family protein [Bradyrhizobium prioriisuperbiae]|uniref:sulfite exporter TauE/SafE family protein n=1 Tax=Bradyrhizobium prioriisuperbiae TaxID=2854389 RepID=UPI0028F0CCAD|nr:sulfite exporter TauE/SafE family protein [Bradyrhizobium prioritasuperba]
MDWTIVTLLIAAGVAGGIINAIAGGATLITFPAMLAAGLSPVLANASNAVAISPGHLIAALADRDKLPPFNRRFAWSLTTAVLGGIGGALLLLALPDRLFVLPVPALIGFATLLFAFAPQIQAWAEHRWAGAAPSATAELAVLAGASIYGGFFGAGLGIVLTAVLSIAEPNDIRKVKVLKNLLATGVSVAAIVVFVGLGVVQWRETMLMLLGALVGGYAGGYLVRVLPANVVRWAVIVAGTVMTAVYIRRYWF